jgi:hypothetical protein
MTEQGTQRKFAIGIGAAICNVIALASEAAGETGSVFNEGEAVRFDQRPAAAAVAEREFTDGKARSANQRPLSL